MPATPNHALQRTGSAVTAPAADHRHLSAHRQVPRPLRLSLSLGSFDRKHAMGLSAVELIMAVEDEFGIELAEADAAKLAVLGEMHAHIVQAIRQRGESPNETDVWERLRAIVVEQLGVQPAEVTRAAHLVKDLGAD